MPFRWGIIGLGSIARKFGDGLRSVPDAELAAVASRSLDKANHFGDEFGPSRRYGSYQDLLTDPDINAVYIATPHPFHHQNALDCLRAGKAVLCEKPFTLNAQQAIELVEVSEEHRVFLMEAMWTRFLPIMRKVREVVSEGAIGDIRLIEADFGFRADFDPLSRLLSPNLGGGALLDVGVYPISFASMLLGKPTSVAGLAHIGVTGVDEQSAYILKFNSGELAVLSSAVRTNSAQEAKVYGTKGWIKIGSPWWFPRTITVSREGHEPETIVPELIGNGYNYEIIEVQRCVTAGKIESEIMPHAETISIMETMDTLRSQWGLKYPSESQ